MFNIPKDFLEIYPENWNFEKGLKKKEKKYLIELLTIGS